MLLLAIGLNSFGANYYDNIAIRSSPDANGCQAPELKQWMTETYPAFATQLAQPVYTRFPHPADGL